MMIDQAVRQGRLLSVIVLIVGVLGLAAALRMPVQMIPDLDTRIVRVETGWPGATPQDVEKEILLEQERYLRSIPNLRRMESFATMGEATVELEFPFGVDVNEVLIRVANALSQVPGYPENVDQPRLYSDSFSENAFMYFAVLPLEGNPQQLLDARENDVRWQTGEWGAFATDRAVRPVAPGTNITSPMGGGGAPGGPQMPVGPQAPAPQPGATPTAAVGGDFPSRMGAVLASAGLPQAVVAGILANGHYESGGRWNEAVGDGGTAHGALQWRNERVNNFQRVMGVHPSQAGPEQTAQFVLWELQNPQAAGMSPQQVQAILGAQDPREAAVLFSQHYERPNPRLANNERRAALALEYAGMGGGNVQYAQASMPNMPGQGRSIQEQAATGMVMPPPRQPPPQTPAQQRGDTLQNRVRELDIGEREQQMQTREEARSLMRALIGERLHGQVLHTRAVLMELNDL